MRTYRQVQNCEKLHNLVLVFKIQKLYWKSCLIFFFEKKSYFITRILRIIEKTLLWRFCYPMFALDKSNVFNKYFYTSSFHLFCCCNHVSSCKSNSLFRPWTWRVLFTTFTHACKHLFWPTLPEWCNCMEKYLWDFSFVKARTWLWKTSRLAGAA